MNAPLAFFLSVVWLSTLGAIGFGVWLRQYAKLPQKEIETLRSEMAALALAVGLQKNRIPTGFPPQGFPPK